MLKVPTVRKTYVTLIHFEHVFSHLELLQKLQQLSPNTPIEVQPSDDKMHLRQFIPIHCLVLDDLRLIRRMNP